MPARHWPHPDGATAASGRNKAAPTLSRFAMLHNRRFVTLSAAFALGLFAQIGLFVHLIVRLSPTVGTGGAGAAVSAATVCAVVGRTIVAAWLGDHDRRAVAALNFAVRATGVCLLAFGAGSIALWAGCVLFGLGVSNLTTLPPLMRSRSSAKATLGRSWRGSLPSIREHSPLRRLCSAHCKRRPQAMRRRFCWPRYFKFAPR